MRARRLPLEVDVKEIQFECMVRVGESVVVAFPGDYLITNALGETYPVRRDVFLMQYEIVEE